MADGFRAEVRHKTPDGTHYRSATFPKRAQAQVWMGRAEEEYRQGRVSVSDKTLADALKRYEREVSPTHRGARWEALRLAAWADRPIAKTKLYKLTSDDLGGWRDERLKDVSAATVRREFALLSSVLEEARREWKWITHNPVRDVRKPPAPQPRSRRISESEVRAMVKALGYVSGTPPETLQHEVAIALLLAIETAMRAGEIVGLTWDRVYLERRFLTLPLTKNGTARDVPLSAAAVELLTLMKSERAKVFRITASSLDALWRKARDRAAKDIPALKSIHFHDSRAEALTRLARKVDVMRLSKISGHKDIKLLVSTYYRETAEELANLL